MREKINDYFFELGTFITPVSDKDTGSGSENGLLKSTRR